MKIAIFSDLHDDWQNLKKFLDFCQQEKISTIISCGDLTNEETFEYLATNFSGQILMVGGNADLFDIDKIKKYSQITYEANILATEIAGLKILAIHKPKELTEILEKTPNQFDFAFFGHTHRPDFKKTGKTITANPGTLNGPLPQASFAVLDSNTKRLELKILSQI